MSELANELFEVICYVVLGGVVLLIVLGAVLAVVFGATGIGTDKQEDDDGL